MTINKRFLSIMLSLLLVFGALGSTFCVEATAAAVPTLSTESKSVTVGDTFTVAVKLSNVSSVYGGNFTLQYDSSILSAESYSFGSIISGHTKNCNLNYQSAGNLIRFTFSGAEAVSSSGTLVTITFKAKNSGTASLKFNAYKMYDQNGSALTSSATGSSITVKAKASSAPTLSTESKSVTVGDTFTVAVKLSNVSSVYGGNFTLQYDSSLLSAESYSFGSIISGHTKNCNLNYQSAGNLIRFTFSGAEALSSSGTLVTITFKAKASGTASLKFNAYKMYDQNGSALTSSATGSSITVKAKATTYTVSYNANGGTGAPSSQTKTHGVTLTLSSTKPTRTGYTFLGWSTSSSATSATYLAGGSFTTNANTTLYAVWKRITYTISYNANGGTGAPSSQTKTYDVTLTLSSTKPTRTGYTFLGWSTSSSATSATYSAGGSYTANSNATLYAVWKSAGKAAQIIVESKEVSKGTEFTVTVSLKNNPGIAALLITPVYSDELTLVSVENGKLLSDFTKGKNYLWDSASDVKTDGVLMTLKFKTASTVKSGTYNVGFTVSSCINADLNNVNVKVTEGKITVKDFIWGDANGDGDVTPADVVLLRRYFANYNSDTGISSITIFPGADANGDGEVTPADVVLLRRYFANYDSATDSSSIILGPTQKLS